MSDPTTCTRCGLRPRVPRQRWCLSCRNEYKRLSRRTRRGTPAPAENGPGPATHGLRADQDVGTMERVVQAGQAPSEKGRPALSPPSPYVPFTGSQPPREPWYPAFLSDLAINGGISLAAAAADVHRSLVYRRLDDDPAFAEEVDVAKAYYRDLLEWESVNLARRKDNPLPYFARLKAELPSRYIDRQAILLATPSDNLEPGAGAALLHAMFGQGADASPPTVETGASLPAHPQRDGSMSGASD